MRTMKAWVTVDRHEGYVLSVFMERPGRCVHAWLRNVPCTITYDDGKPPQIERRRGGS